MKRYYDHLQEIIDFTMRGDKGKWPAEAVEQCADSNNFKLHDDYSYYLQNYGNDYLKDDYCFIPNISMDGINKVGVDGIFGLSNDANNLSVAIGKHNEYLPRNLFPVADATGGDLFCMDRESGQVYFWLHEADSANIFFAGESFSDFILSINYAPAEKTIKPASMKLSSALDEALKQASQKHKK